MWAPYNSITPHLGLNRKGGVVFLKKQNGSALTMAIVATAITATFIFIAVTWMKSISRNGNVTYAKSGADLIMSEVVNALGNDEIWAYTLNTVATTTSHPLYCYRFSGADQNAPGVTPCAPISNLQIPIYVAGSAFVGTAANDGFSADGQACHNYPSGISPTSGLPCMYQVQVLVNVSCDPSKDDPLTKNPDPASCQGARAKQTNLGYGFFLDPPIHLTVKVSIAPERQSEYGQLSTSDKGNYNYSFVRGQNATDVASTCESLGGTYNQNTGFCSNIWGHSGNYPSSCKEGFIYAFDASRRGLRSCQEIHPKKNTVCEKKTAVYGIDSNGDFICYKY